METIKANKIIYFAGTLRIDKGTLMPFPIQNNLVLGIKKIENNNIYIIIGFLTNNITDENYKECNNDNMPSYELLNIPMRDYYIYITSLKAPLKVKEEDFIVNDIVTKDIQSPNILDKLDKLLNILMKEKPIPYNPVGVTKEELLIIIKRFDLDQYIKQLLILENKIKELETLLIKYRKANISCIEIQNILDNNKNERDTLVKKIEGFKKDLNIKD